MNPDSGSSQSGLINDRTLGIALVILAVLALIRRALMGHVPGDLTAYLHAADLFMAGENVYSDARFDASRYDGYPYNYAPGTLYLIAPLAWLDSSWAASLDWIARLAALAVTSRLMARHLFGISAVSILVVAVALEPLAVDLLRSNLVTFLMLAFVWVECVARRESIGSWSLVSLVIVGVLVAFKPMWIIPIGFALVLRRHWVRLAMVVLGGLGVAGLTLLNLELFPDWLSHLEQISVHNPYVSLWNIHSALGGLVAVVALSAGAWVVWKRPRHPDAWLLACATPVFWPRIVTYSFALVLPVVVWLIERLGWLRGLVLSAVVLGPVPWMVREYGTLPDHQLEGWLLMSWTACLGGIIFWRVARGTGEAQG